MENKLVGELNGKWSILFRALMATVAIMLPFVIAIGTWTTVTLFDLKTEIALMKAKNEYFLHMLEDVRIDIEALKVKLGEIQKGM